MPRAHPSMFRQSIYRWTGARQRATCVYTMFRYFRALDPRRSLATAVAWLAVVLSLAIALALVAVGDYAANSMLAQRDALMKRFAGQVAADLERALMHQAQPGAGAPVLPSQERLAALVQ